MFGHFILHITAELLSLLRGKKRPDGYADSCTGDKSDYCTFFHTHLFIVTKCQLLIMWKTFKDIVPHFLTVGFVQYLMPHTRKQFQIRVRIPDLSHTGNGLIDIRI